MRGDWIELVHPSGAIYNYNARMVSAGWYLKWHAHFVLTKVTYAEMNLRTCSDERLRKLESWIEASRAKLSGGRYLLVVEPIVVRKKEVYPYYYVVLENHIITWVEPVDGYLLFQESMASHWNHKSESLFCALILRLDWTGLELEAQYWWVTDKGWRRTSLTDWVGNMSSIFLTKSQYPSQK